MGNPNPLKFKFLKVPTLECLVIDGGPIDNSLNIIQDFVNQHAGNWSIITNKDRCPSAAQNLGIHNTKSEYLVFLVADDFWHPNKLKR